MTERTTFQPQMSDNTIDRKETDVTADLLLEMFYQWQSKKGLKNGKFVDYKTKGETGVVAISKLHIHHWLTTVAFLNKPDYHRSKVYTDYLLDKCGLPQQGRRLGDLTINSGRELIKADKEGIHLFSSRNKPTVSTSFITLDSFKKILQQIVKEQYKV